MKRLLGYGSCLAGGALLALAAQPVYASATVITGVRIIPTDTGAQIVLRTESGDTPQVFAVNQGNSLRADIVRTELQLSNGEEFVEQNPVPGIASVTLVPLDGNSVRLTVNGSNRLPVGTIAESDGGGIVIDVETSASATPQASTPVPEELVTVPGPETVAQADPEEPEETPAPAEPAQSEGEPDVLVPNPQVIIDGVPIPAPQEQQIPPFLPQAVPPPVGDIAVAETNPDFGEIDLGTAERVPRLVLREAPSREVLSLLARAAGLNVVFVDAGEEEDDDEATGEGPPITLDIENESVQDVFNSVLRVTGLQANRVGRTIYVGRRLPLSAQNVTVRTLRMNQVEATVASNFLVGLGAESAISRERQVTIVDAVDISEGAPPLTQTQTVTEQRVETQRVDFQDSTPIFRGLQVIAEERTNSVTLIGSPQLVELATAQLVRLDLRRRQVAINLKVIDVDLNAIDAFGTSFSFANGDFDFASQGGVGVINFGGQAPGGSATVPPDTPFGAIGLPGGSVVNLAERFLGQILATVQEGNAKILTDPTLIVQEGQTASVQLTEEVVTDFDVDQEVDDNGNISTTIDIETEPAGLVLQIDVARIDDNGFVTLSVAPSISAPVGIETFSFTGVSNAFVTLLSERQLSSGQIRVRDGQTLVLSGIIQETDRTTVSKVPILGDLPLIGSLFRSTRRTNERLELIVMLTPQILDDSDQSSFGYSYTPSEEVQDLIDQSRDR
ncbi:MAG: AMIN domain-containing protein [Leptolyngbya sp. SIO1D8]|nr:AMIN domain-containing protein [Leptolyngbya sp. SIO1D8]